MGVGAGLRPMAQLSLLSTEAAGPTTKRSHACLSLCGTLATKMNWKLQRGLEKSRGKTQPAKSSQAWGKVITLKKREKKERRRKRKKHTKPVRYNKVGAASSVPTNCPKSGPRACVDPPGTSENVIGLFWGLINRSDMG